MIFLKNIKRFFNFKYNSMAKVACKELRHAQEQHQGEPKWRSLLYLAGIWVRNLETKYTQPEEVLRFLIKEISDTLEEVEIDIPILNPDSREIDWTTINQKTIIISDDTIYTAVSRKLGLLRDISLAFGFGK